MRIPSYDDLTPSIPDVSPGDVFAAAARLLPAAPAAPANSQIPIPNSQISQCSLGSWGLGDVGRWELGVGSLFACLRSARLPEAVERIARDFSPRIQRYGSDAVVLDVSGLGRLLGSPQTIGAELAKAAAALAYSDVRLAIAPTQTAALLLTLSDPGPTVVTADECAALAPLPLQCLQQHMAALLGTTILRRDRTKPFDDDFAVLRRWGLKTLGEFAALPAPDLSARMGQTGLALQQLARGVDPGPLVPDPGVTRFIQRMELEWPIEALEPLSFVLARLLEPLSSALERAGRAAAAIRLQLRLVDRTTHERVLQLPAAIRDPRVLRTLLLLDLESHAPPTAVDVVTIEVDPAPGRVIQYSLLERALPSPETLATLMARLGALVGDSRCGSPHLPDTHRPDAFEMHGFSPSSQLPASSSQHPRVRQGFHRVPSPESRVPSLRRFRPPVAVRVTVNRGRPVHLAIDRRGMPGGDVVQAAGPWRSSGAWWDIERPRPTRGAGLPAEAPPARRPAFAKAPAGSLRSPSSAKAGRKPGEAGPPSVKLAGVGPREHEPTRGAGRKPGEAGPPSVKLAGVGPREHEQKTPWDRDEWDVELGDGGLCRLFHDRRAGVWFLDGIFD